MSLTIFLFAVSQFGYITLFAPAFPLGFLIAYINNLIEIRTDGFKICTLYRRPMYRCAEDIGTWQYVLGVMSVVGTITNAAMMSFTSDTLNIYFTKGWESTDQWVFKLLLAFGVEVGTAPPIRGVV